MSERDEQNLKLAEFVGFRFQVDSTMPLCGTWHAPKCKCPATLPASKCTCLDACYLGEENNKPPDFFLDETANAMLLEKMPMPRVHKWSHRIYRDRFYWSVSPNRDRL